MLDAARKVAVVMAALGPELAAKVYEHLDEEEVERVTLEIAQAQPLPGEERLEVLREFHDLQESRTTLTMGTGFAQAVLERAFGLQRAREMLARVAESVAPRPFAFLQGLDPVQLLMLLQGEHPQTIALVLSFLDPAAAALILKNLTPEQQGDVASRVAMMESTNPQLVASVAAILERKIEALFGADLARTGGIDAVVQLLTRVDRSTERGILGSMEGSDPELADEIRRRMFLFEDFRSVQGRDMQRIIREVDQKDIVLALRTASDEIAQLFFRNMSQRMAEVVREDLALLPPTRLRDLEAAQQRIVALARHLEEAGEIILSEGHGDDAMLS